jgi:hypothetical protein
MTMHESVQGTDRISKKRTYYLLLEHHEFATMEALGYGTEASCL